MAETISDEHVKEICKIGQGKDCCKFITMGVGGFECAKGTEFESIILARGTSMSAQGDNCKGIK